MHLFSPIHEFSPDARSFVIIGRSAKTSSEFLLDDLPSTSGRMDVLIRCVRAALLISHGVRADTGVYLLLMGPPNPPITIYIRGSEARYLRPDERSIATTIKKALAKELPQSGLELIRNGIYIGAVGLSDILQFISSESSVFVLDEVGSDIRNRENASGKAAFIIGDHQGFSVEEWKIMSNFSKQQLSVGPVSLQAEDVIALVHNQLDREQILVP